MNKLCKKKDISFNPNLLKMPLNIGLIGAGRMGSTLAHHLAFALELANLVAIAATRSLDEARPVTVAEVGG